MEKTWQTDPNFTIATTSSYLVMGQSIMMALKNRMVANAGWTVVGSADGVRYEYEGVTAGGVYGGDSTGPYDVWESIGVIQRQPDGLGPGWCILKSPAGKHGPFYALIAMEGTSDLSQNGFTWYSNQNWELHPSTPIIYLPTRASGAVVHGRSRYDFFLMYGGTYTTRGYFSGAPEDGSFIFALNLTLRTYFTGLQMFHVMDYAHPDLPMPTCSYSQSSNNAWDYNVNADQFYAYHPRYASVYTGSPTGSSGTRCVATFPVYKTSRIYNIMSTTNYATEVDAFPLFLIAEEDTNESGRNAFIGRIPDLYNSPEGLNEADTMPSGGLPEHFKFGDWILPGDTTPSLGP